MTPFSPQIGRFGRLTADPPDTGVLVPEWGANRQDLNTAIGDDLRDVAIHEAGHAAAVLAKGYAPLLKRVSILPDPVRAVDRPLLPVFGRVSLHSKITDPMDWAVFLVAPEVSSRLMARRSFPVGRTTMMHVFEAVKRDFAPPRYPSDEEQLRRTGVARSVAEVEATRILSSAHSQTFMSRLVEALLWDTPEMEGDSVRRMFDASRSPKTVAAL